VFQSLRLKRPLAFVDVESTGVNPQTDRVVEVGVYKICPGEKPVSVARRVNPTVPISAAVSRVHGITDADVADCRPFAAIARTLVRFLDGCDLAGFGIKKFDLPILAAECRRAGVHFPLAGRAVIDALQIYHQRERRTLEAALSFYVGAKHAHAHRASDDARVSALVLDAQLRRPPAPRLPPLASLARTPRRHPADRRVCLGRSGRRLTGCRSPECPPQLQPQFLHRVLAPPDDFGERPVQSLPVPLAGGRVPPERHQLGVAVQPADRGVPDVAQVVPLPVAPLIYPVEQVVGGGREAGPLSRLPQVQLAAAEQVPRDEQEHPARRQGG
jgi:DNA polymerase III epsilon subunit-like protein